MTWSTILAGWHATALSWSMTLSYCALVLSTAAVHPELKMEWQGGQGQFFFVSIRNIQCHESKITSRKASMAFDQANEHQGKLIAEQYICYFTPSDTCQKHFFFTRPLCNLSILRLCASLSIIMVVALWLSALAQERQKLLNCRRQRPTCASPGWRAARAGGRPYFY